MVSLLDSMVSSSARKMPIRKRGDLVASRHHYLGQTYWVVKDPIGLTYFRFQDEEYQILNWLDGETSLDEIKERFEEEFPPQKITLEELHRFLGMLHRSGLILTAVPGQGSQLLKRRGERRRQKLLQALSNILCVQFKGFDPERILEWLEPKFGWVFTLPAFICALLFGLSALMLVMVEFDVFRSKLPSFYQFFNLHNAFWLAIVLGTTKVLHEFGHGLSCKHFGGECHEMGVMILVLTPCLYCNVSDSWMLPNKWQRIAIGGAGMYVELIIASLATYVWWFTEPGLLNNLCLNVMFISSVSTVFFNGNPLLRYDGYYMMADWAEIPNLRQKATMILSRKMGEWFLGLEQQEDPFLPKRNLVFFVLFSIASAIYRWVVVFSILWFLYQFWRPYKLEIIGHILGLMSIGGLVVVPLWQLGKFFYTPGRAEQVKKPRMYASLAGVALLVLAAFTVPLPHRIWSSLEIVPYKAASIYVEVGGLLEQLDVRSGDRVQTGQVLAKLKNVDLELEINKLESSAQQYRVQLDNLRRMRLGTKGAGSEIPQLTEALATVEGQLKQKQTDMRRLTLVAPRDGVVMPPPERARREDAEEQLPKWQGSPLEPENVGAHLEPSELFCQIGDPKQMEAILVIEQADIEFVAPGQEVIIKLNEMPFKRIYGKISQVASADLKVTPHRLSSRSGGEVASKVDPVTGQERPQTTSFQARVPLEDADGLLRLGLQGQAKIYAPPQPLTTQVWRYITHAFNFRL